MTAAIEKLVLENFRGASNRCEIKFDKKPKQLVIIFGENGTGKSAIVDAIDFVCNKSIGSLLDRSMGKNKHPYVACIGMKTTDIRVELTANDNTWIGKQDGRMVDVTGDGDMPQVSILRRSQLLKLIDARPAERYEALRSFIDVSNIEKSEATLRNAINDVKKEHDKSNSQLEQSKQLLRELWEKEGSPNDNFTSWARDKSGVDSEFLETKVKTLHMVIQSLIKANEKKLEFENTTNDQKEAQDKLNIIEKEIDELPSIEGKKATELVALLKKANDFIAKPSEFDNCPVCLQPVVADELRSSINKRLEDNNKYVVLERKHTNTINDYEVCKKNRENAVEALVKQIRTTTKFIHSESDLLVQTKTIKWCQYQKFMDSDSVDDEQLVVATGLMETLEPFKQEYDNAYKEIQTNLNQLNSIQIQYKNLKNNTEKAKSLKCLLDRLEKAESICRINRNNFTQDILNSIADEANRLYKIIHPREKLGSLKLEIYKRSSINQTATFEERENVPPQGYFSESHLDTLGLCVWLALAKRHEPREMIIVLDDVFTSVDGEHVRRIKDVINEVKNEFGQVIITTHYRYFQDLYKQAKGPGQQAQLLELLPWSLSGGIRVYGTKSAIEELKIKIDEEPLDRQGISSKAGVMLEAILSEVGYQYRINIPADVRNKRTLGELLNACKRLFDKLEIEREVLSENPDDIEGPKLKLENQFDDVNEIFIRNQVGGHYNIDGLGIPDVDVKAFGNATLNLAIALTCRNCGEIPSKGEGSYFRCSCKKTKMRPLKYKR